jgi:predicted RNA binding protein YcfA (HicA-like mRNA interferase family)
MNLPMLTSEEILKVLKRQGFLAIRQRGSHVRLRHQDGRTVTVPSHSCQDVGKGLLRKILRDAELSFDDLLK